MTIAPHRTSVNPPENWTAEYDDHGHITHWMGPSLWVPGIDIYTASDPHHGPQAYSADGEVIPTWHLVKYAVKLLRLHSELTAAQAAYARHASRQEAQR